MPSGAKWEEQFNVVVVSSFDLPQPLQGSGKEGIIRQVLFRMREI